MSCGVGCRRGSDLEFLWLWYRPAAMALIQPLIWELPYAKGAALKSQKKKCFCLSIWLPIGLTCCDFKNIDAWEFSLWVSGLRTPHGVPEDAGSIPGLT